MNLFEHLPTISQLTGWVRENGGWLGILGVLLTIFFGVLGIWISLKNGDPDLPVSTDPPGHSPRPSPTVEIGTIVSASGNGVAIGANSGSIFVTRGYTPEQLRALIADRTKLAELEARLEVTGQTLRRFFEILEQEEVPPGQWPVRLGEIAERHKQALKRLAALETGDLEAQALLGQARTAIEAGDHGRAESLLDQAEKRELAGIEAEEASLDRRRLSAAAIRAEQGELSLIQLRYREAAERFAAAAELVPDSKPEQRLAYRKRHANALYRQGDEKGDNAALEEAIRAYRDLLGEYPRKRAPLDWATTQNNLGNALGILGEREAGRARLEEAVAAFRTALQEYTRDRVPLQWAGTQNNLGNALLRLGERESGTARLEEAVAAYRAALQEYTREKVPLQWAMTQNNLGNALMRLGERESGTARLEEAVAAYRAALQEFTRDRVPLQWATTQNNLGVALATLGGREVGTARLEEAVAAYRDALQEWTRERVPLQWATTQNNLGTALAGLGERESGTARLEQAVAAFRDALQEYTRERVPLDWARTQNNLGNALMRLGERESGTARLEQAVAAFRDALQEYTRERVPLDWARTQNNLGNALWRLGERESGTARLEKARRHTENAWQLYQDAGMDQYDEYFRQRLAAIDRLLEERR